MSSHGTDKNLKKELTLLNVYAIATGTTLAAGFFLIPGIAAKVAGPALVVSYLLAAIPMIPAMFCMMELATAMPRAGGSYYFLDRSMGPLIGTIGGFGTWISLILKSAVALIGMGAYLNLFIPGDYMILIAVGFAILFGLLNLKSAKESGSVQIYMVGGIIVLLLGFIVTGFFHIESSHFNGFFNEGFQSVFETAGLVYISYAGVTKVTSVSEEVKDPEKNLPLGMILAFLTAIVAYGVGTYILVGVVPMDQLKGNLTPVATAAEMMVGTWGKVLVTIAAVFAFASSTNAGILSASRYPMAMSRDQLLPKGLGKFNKKGVPVWAVILTVAIILFFIIFFNPMKIAKLASAFQLMIFALCCFAVVIMRESHIEAYDPGFVAPFYPWLPILGIIAPMVLITEMGIIPVLATFGLMAICTIWYFYYARQKVERNGAILHLFERLGQYRHEGLESELRGILKEKGLRDHDPFEQFISQAQIVDLDNEIRFDELVHKASIRLAETVSYPAEKIEEEILTGTKVGGTPVSGGVALPHMRLHHIIEPVLLLVRSRNGIRVDMEDGFWGVHTPTDNLKAVFFLISPEENPKQHLRILAKIAGRVDDDHFMTEWLEAKNEQELREVIMRDESFITLKLRPKCKASVFINKKLREIRLPENTLIAIINRDGKTIVPRGETVIKDGDRLTVIGNQKGVHEFRRLYGS